MEQSLKKQFDAAWRDPAAAISGMKNDEGKRALGLIHTDVPHELVHAAGALPTTVQAKEVTFAHADKHLQGFACSYSRSVVELAASGELDFLDGVVVPYACDTTRCLDLIFKHLGKFAFTDCLRLPKRSDSPSAGGYYESELRRLAASLSDFTGAGITDESLTSSIGLYNHVRELLAKLRDGLRVGAGGLTASEYFSAVRAAMALPPEASTPLLEQAVADLGADGQNSAGAAVVLAGKVPEPPGVIDALSNAGLRIVEDHLVIGGRWVQGVVPEAASPWEGLVKRQLSQLPFAGIWDDRPSRSSYVLERTQATGAAGVVYLVQKFCEPAEVDVPGIREEVEAAKIPILVLETDYHDAGLAAVKTRIEAFAEILAESAG